MNYRPIFPQNREAMQYKVWAFGNTSSVLVCRQVRRSEFEFSSPLSRYKLVDFVRECVLSCVVLGLRKQTATTIIFAMEKNYSGRIIL